MCIKTHILYTRYIGLFLLHVPSALHTGKAFYHVSVIVYMFHEDIAMHISYICLEVEVLLSTCIQP